ncbi:UNVERIFIED_CONTAM: putative transcription factor [Sesamum latifolium]|uniref:Transcription factor n=1 Tax=Sesamum latifolium TaxID=2727402 RepID=A0AAW2WNN6_9LAMI
MAKNREPEKPVESETESGEEEDEEATSEDAGSQDSDSEPEQTQVSKKPSSSTQATPKKAQPQSSSKPQPQPPSSSDEEESGSESESDSEEPDPNVRPIASKPMENEQKSSNGARKLRSKPIASDLATPAKPTAAKRPAEEKETEAKDAKKSKKKAEPDTEKKSTDDSKKLLFQRLLSEDDEIVILKGMIDYVTKKKSDPVADLNAFHDFIKKNLHVDVTRTQLQDKIRRLRRKYENNKSKEKEGKDRTFSKPHEQKAYELSKKIWGNENGKEHGVEKVTGSPKVNGSALRKTPSKKPNMVENEEAKDVKSADVVNSDTERLLPAKRVNSGGGSVEERILRIGAEFLKVEKGSRGKKSGRS